MRYSIELKEADVNKKMVKQVRNLVRVFLLSPSNCYVSNDEIENAQYIAFKGRATWRILRGLTDSATKHVHSSYEAKLFTNLDSVESVSTLDLFIGWENVMRGVKKFSIRST
jgi:hypothetical protein